MAAEPTRTVFRLMSDARLVAGVEGAVTFIGEQMGFAADQCARLAKAVSEASRNTFPLLQQANEMVGVTLEQFADRMEVVVEHKGQALPTAGLDTFAIPGAAESGTGGMSGLSLLHQVDRVQYDSRGGVSRMRLIKYLPGSSGPKKSG